MVRWVNAPADINAMLHLQNGQDCGEQAASYDAGRPENELLGQYKLDRSA